MNAAHEDKRDSGTGGDDGKVVALDAKGTVTVLATDPKRRWIDNVALHPDGAVAWSAGKVAHVRTGKGEGACGLIDLLDLRRARELGRATQGVTLIALDDGAKLTGLQRIVENDANGDAAAPPELPGDDAIDGESA